MRDLMHGCIAVDGHVHLHECFSVEGFFDAALENFQRSEHGAGRSPIAGILCLTESHGVSAFRVLRSRARDSAEGHGGWRFLSTGESTSLIAERAGSRLAVVAGRQIVTRDGLEVLGLNTELDISDGAPFGEVLDRVRQNGVAVVPWGFGKWCGRRLKLIRAAISGSPPGSFLLGDNGGRLAAWRAPALFARAREKRFWRLAGTDPLPFPRQVGRVGRYGSLLPYTVDPDRPGTSLVRCLRKLTADPPVYGDLEGIGSFVLNQSRMQLRKRMARRFE